MKNGKKLVALAALAFLAVSFVPAANAELTEEDKLRLQKKQENRGSSSTTNSNSRGVKDTGSNANRQRVEENKKNDEINDGKQKN